MKNKCILATMVAFGLLIASCSSDSDEIKTSSQRLTTELILKSGDSIPTTFATDDVILPPKKP
ncbi:hypothetical protein [Flavobacterium sp.]|uniref:hypothetical protein n=1 Tax=Flavobacterium sp. TaxID=239 RepID=UPI00286EA459|nr:hypothetical protein [Flavobacterium sp.]